MKNAMNPIQFEGPCESRSAFSLTNEIILAQKTVLRGPLLEMMCNALLSVPLTSVQINILLIMVKFNLINSYIFPIRPNGHLVLREEYAQDCYRKWATRHYLRSASYTGIVNILTNTSQNSFII